MKRSREFFVGLFSLAAIVIFVIFTVSLQDLSFFSKTDKYYVTFKSVSKLEPGASVLVHGVKEGVVSKIESISGPHPVLVTLKLNQHVKLFTNAKIAVSSPGVIGDTTVDIDSGAPAPDSELALPEHQFVGVETADLSKVVGELSVDLSKVAAELQKTLVSINSILSDKENQRATRALLLHLGSATEETDKTLKMLNEQLGPLLTEVRDTVGRSNKFLDSGTSLTQQLSGDVAATRRSVVSAVDQWKQTGAGAQQEIHQTAVSIQSVTEKLNAMLDSNRAPLASTIESLHAASQKLENTLDAVQRGDGTMGLLINDPRPFNELRQAISALNRVLTGGRESIMPVVAPTPRTRAQGIAP